MLVLSRKTGEQIVLPSCGATVAVIGISGNKVRLGVHAPPETSVHRREIRDRVSNDRKTRTEGRPTASAKGQPRHDEPAVLPETDLCSRLCHHIAQRTFGRIHSLQVERVDGRIVVSGRASTYYARQLACAATVELLERPGQGDVQFDIQVIPDATEMQGD